MTEQRAQVRERVARAIASKTYAFGGSNLTDDDRYDCGEWEEMGSLAHATYYDAADAVLLSLTERRDHGAGVGEAIERCAKVAEERATLWRTGNEGCSRQSLAAFDLVAGELDDVASAIRALASEGVGR